MLLTKLFFLIVIAYLIGSISTGVLLSKIFGQGNLQTQGSKNIGATNVSRLMGRKWGIITLIGDMVKGIIPLGLALGLLSEQGKTDPLFLSLIALAAFLGHLFPIYLRFKGGKGVATALGIFLFLAPKAVLVVVPIFIVVVYLGKYVSLGSIVAAGTFPVLLILFKYPTSMILLSLIIASAVILKHRQNIIRLIKGEEQSWHKG